MGENLYKPIDNNEKYYDTDNEDSSSNRRKSVFQSKSEELEKKKKKNENENTNTESEKKISTRLIRIHLMITCLQCVSASVTYSSLWPYMTTINNTGTLGEINLGLVISCRSAAEIGAMAIFRYWSIKRNAKEPLILSSILFIIGNLMYGLAEGIKGPGVVLVLVSRVISGVSAGSLGVSRLEVSRLSEDRYKKRHMTYLGMAISSGFFLGPLLQNLFTLIGPNGLHIKKADFKFSMYSGPAYALALVGILYLVLIIIYYKTGSTKLERIPPTKSNWRAIFSDSIDKKSFIVLMLIYIVLSLDVVQHDVIFAPIIMNVIGLTKVKTVQYGAVLASISAILGFVGYIMVPLLKMKFTNRKIMLGCLCIFVINYIIYQPGSGSAILKVMKTRTFKIDSNKTLLSGSITGCPEDYKWCHTTKRLKQSQFTAFIIIDALSTPIAFTALPIIFGKLIGNDNLETYISLLGNLEALGKIIWPLYATLVYHSHGLLGVAQISLWLNVFVTVVFLVAWKRLANVDE